MTLEIKNLEKQYGNKKALCGINLSMHVGIYGILGEKAEGSRGNHRTDEWDRVE